MRDHVKSQREKATALTRALEPLIVAHFEKMAQPRPVVIHADAQLVEAAVKVAEAVTRIEESRYTRSEIHARSALERAAIELRSRMKKIPARHGGPA